MASGRLRIGHGSPSHRVLIAEYASYSLLGQSLNFSYSGGAAYYGGPDLGYLTPTIYAAPAALGTGSGNSEANAMAMTTALSTAAAGDIIGALPGIYSKAAAGNKFQPAWQITNNGTAGNPIIVVAKYSAIDLAGKVAGSRWTTGDLDTVFAHSNRSELRHTGTSNGTGGGTGGPTFGASFLPNQKEYHYWIGFCVDEAQASPLQDSGPVVLWASVGSKILRSVIRGRAAPWDPAIGYDNHNGVRCEDFEDGAEVSDNVIYGFLEDASGDWSTHNHCGIQRYAHDTITSGLRVYHNYIFGSHTGIFLKDETDPVDGPYASDEIVRYNILDSNVSGIEVAKTNRGATDDYVDYNIVAFCNTGITGQQGQGNRVHIVYNTIYAGAQGPSSGEAISANNFGTGCEIRNNIVYGTSGNMLYEANYRTSAMIPTDYNVYYSASGFRGRYNGANYTGSGGTALNTWKSGSGEDDNSIFSDPLFVNASAFDFSLQVGSPARTASSSGGVVGHTAGSDTPGPRYA